mmetsp:Transcript_3424/g.9599  ORF Transcript_3424/g.9599 Transcript_3424/m.9599 type:complete len:331 (+) Transcript_3424:256-1248(+)
MLPAGLPLPQQDRGTRPAHCADPTPGRHRKETLRAGPVPDQEGTKAGPQAPPGAKTTGAPGPAGRGTHRATGTPTDPPELYPGHGRPGLRRSVPDGTKGDGAGPEATAGPLGTKRGQETLQGAKGRETPQQGPEGCQPDRQCDGCHPRRALFRQERFPSLPPHQDRPQRPAAQHHGRSCRVRLSQPGLRRLRGWPQGHSEIHAAHDGPHEMEGTRRGGGGRRRDRERRQRSRQRQRQSRSRSGRTAAPQQKTQETQVRSGQPLRSGLDRNGPQAAVCGICLSALRDVGTGPQGPRIQGGWPVLEPGAGAREWVRGNDAPQACRQRRRRRR